MHRVALTILRPAVGRMRSPAFLDDKGDRVAAEPLYTRALKEFEASLGCEHTDSLIGADDLASLLEDKGDVASAGMLYRKAPCHAEMRLGHEHPPTLTIRNNLAVFFQAQGH
jgi:hypothetical protein